MIVCAPWDEAATLRGSQIVLRPFELGDATELLAALEESREHFFPWLGFAEPLRTIADCHDHIARAQADWLRGERYCFALRAAPGHAPGDAAGRIRGGCDLFVRDGVTGRCSIGYWLRAGEQGQGYMREAVRFVTRFAFERVGANRVEIVCDARNTRSAAVARSLGFAYEGALRHILSRDGVATEMLIFARIRGLQPGDPSDGPHDDN